MTSRAGAGESEVLSAIGMGSLVLLVVFLAIFVLPRVLGRNRATTMKSGVLARGLVLRAASTGGVVNVNGARFESRSVTLDVEVPGQAPYEVSCTALFPRMCESYPGTALDLRVNPRKRNDVAVVGPAGSSGWIDAAAPLVLGAQGASGARSGCGTAVVTLIAVFLAMSALISLRASCASSESEPATEPTHVAPAPAPKPTTAPPKPAPAPSVSRVDCQAAERCCRTLGRAGCASYESMSEAACKSALHQEEAAATKAGKACK